jgi:hypothetical protein
LKRNAMLPRLRYPPPPDAPRFGGGGKDLTPAAGAVVKRSEGLDLRKGRSVQSCEKKGFSFGPKARRTFWWARQATFILVTLSACLAILGKGNRNLMVGVYQEIRHGNLILIAIPLLGLRWEL